MEKYLDKCLTSLILQDQELMKHLEVLVVIDGATDRSSEIAHAYEKKYPDTFRVVDKENGNYGSCVNRGLKEATGKYIKILDADDWFDTNTFQLFMNRLATIDADMVVTDYSTFNQDELLVKKTDISLPKNQVISPHDLTNNLDMHSITYKRCILVDNGYSQTEGISYTDSEWDIIPLLYVKTIYYLNLYVYCYGIGRDGQTVDLNVAFKKYNDFILTSKSIIERLGRYPDQGKICDYIYRKLYAVVYCPYYAVVYKNEGKNDKALKDFDNYLQEFLPLIYKKLDEENIKYDHLRVYYIHNWRKNKNYKLIPKLTRIINKLIKILLGKYSI